MRRVLQKIFPLLLASLVVSAACLAISKTPSASGGNGKVAGASSSRERQGEQDAPPTLAPAPLKPGEKMRVMVIPVQGDIGDPVLYVLRRGLKHAEDEHIGAVVIDMSTLGGYSDAAFQMMEALDKFPGLTITYVKDKAGSAGALIAGVTTEIWYAPKSVIGAAAAVNSDGQDIPETMRLKINSFFGGILRAYSGDKGRYRADVLRAMMDKDYEFKIDDKIINPKGSLLTLTASEALAQYGDPPQPLFGAGSATSIDDLLAQKYGPGNFEITRLEVTWSEQLAQWLNIRMVQILLIGLGLVALFVEFKTPGFGIFGLTGIVCLGFVFFGSYVAGLSGHEPMIIFAIGILLIVGELILHPGLIFPMITGLVLAIGALVWAMADIWPGAPASITWSAETFTRPMVNLVFGLLISVGLGAIVIRYLPKGWFFQRLAVGQAVAGSAQIAGLHPEIAETTKSLIGAKAIAATALMPSGEIEVGGKRYNARLDMGSAPAGAKVVITRMSDFCLIVEEDKTP